MLACEVLKRWGREPLRAAMRARMSCKGTNNFAIDNRN